MGDLVVPFQEIFEGNFGRRDDLVSFGDTLWCPNAPAFPTLQTLKELLTMLALSHLSRSTLSEQSNLQLIERRWGISPALIGERLLPPADDLGVVQKRLGLRLKAVTMC